MGILKTKKVAIALCFMLLTDAKGRYTIKIPPGEYSVAGSDIGYRQITQKLLLKGSSVTKNFKMEESALVLGEVAITTKKANRIIMKEIKGIIPAEYGGDGLKRRKDI